MHRMLPLSTALALKGEWRSLFRGRRFFLLRGYLLSLSLPFSFAHGTFKFQTGLPSLSKVRIIHSKSERFLPSGASLPMCLVLSLPRTLREKMAVCGVTTQYLLLHISSATSRIQRRMRRGSITILFRQVSQVLKQSTIQYLQERMGNYSPRWMRSARSVPKVL